MKVGVAQVANGQVAGAGDLLSLLAGNGTASFASLLNLGASEPGVGRRVDANPAKQGDRPKEKESDKEQPSGVEDSRPGIPSNLLSPQIMPSISPTQWQFDAGAVRTDPGEMSSSSPVLEVANDAGAVRPFSAGARDQSATEPVVGRQPIVNQDATQMLPVQGLSDTESVEPSKELAVGNRNSGATKASAPPTDRGTGSGAVESLPQAPSTALINNSSTRFAGDIVLPPTPQTEADLRLAGMQEVHKSAASNTGVEPVKSDQNPASSLEARRGDPPMQNAPGQVTTSAPPQGVADAASGSAAGGRTQGNAGDAHRGSSEAKEAVATSRSLTPPTSQNGEPGTLGGGGSVQAHSNMANSTQSGPARELPNAPSRELPSPRVADADTARLLGSAMRGDLRVGVQTEAFGRVTIQTSAQGGQLSAQLSLENAKESAALAAHLPSAEQRIVQQHGLNASVRLAGDFAGGAGSAPTGRDQSGSGRRDPERYHDEIAMRPGGLEHGSLNEDRGVAPAVLGGVQLASSRLDVTV